jgi:peptidoglycan hydrolase-like protein with peptidoglycan-binding domain
VDNKPGLPTFRKPMACLVAMILGAGLASATTQSAHHKNSSRRQLAASRRQSGHLELASLKRHKKAKKQRGQQVIEGDRAREIQSALIREGYMKGEPSGAWDQATKDAMTRYQSDHGWQTKTLPDSRALIQLGLGPDHRDAINAKAVPAELPVSAQPGQSSALPGAPQ